MAVKTINIAFPFQNSSIGNFLKLNRTSQAAIKSDLIHLLLTRKGDRLYNNEFGSGLYDFLFEQIDEKTITDIKQELNAMIGKYIPNLTIDELIITTDADGNHVKINIDYTVVDASFEQNDSVEIIL